MWADLTRLPARGNVATRAGTWTSTTTCVVTLDAVARLASQRRSGSSAAAAATLALLRRLPSRASERRVVMALAAKRSAPVRAPYLHWCCRALRAGCLLPWRARGCSSPLRLLCLLSLTVLTCADVPPFKLAQIMAQTEDKSSAAYQRLTWDALRKSINGLVNKVSELSRPGACRASAPSCSRVHLPPTSECHGHLP